MSRIHASANYPDGLEWNGQEINDRGMTWQEFKDCIRFGYPFHFFPQRIKEALESVGEKDIVPNEADA